MLSTGIINLWTNSFQLGEHDVTMKGASPSKLAKIYKNMTKSKKYYSRLGQASRARTQGPTIPQKIIKSKTPEHRPGYQLFFILIFLRGGVKKDKIGLLYGP